MLKKHLKKTLAGLIAAAAIIAFIIMQLLAPSPVEQAATRAGEYFQALTNGTNPGAVYAGWTSDYFKETTDQPLFAKYLSENPIVYQVDYIEFTHQAEETIEIGNIVALQGNVYAEDGSTAILEAHLIKEEGEYKMLYFSFTYPESTDEEEA